MTGATGGEGRQRLPRRPRVVETVDVNQTDDGVVAFDPASAAVYHLNNTASVVLMLCDGQRTEAAIAEGLGRAFGLPEAPRSETRACLRDLARRGLIR